MTTDQIPLAAQFDSQYLADIQDSIRARPIPWEGYLRANLLSRDEASRMKLLEKQPSEARADTVGKEIDLYATTTLSLLGRVDREDVVKHLLCLVADLMTEVPGFVTALLKLSAVDASLPYATLNKLLTRHSNDEAVYLLVVKIMTALLGSENSAPEATVESFLGFLDTLLRSANTNIQDLAVQSLKNLTVHKSFRKVLWRKADPIVGDLLAIIRAPHTGIQLQYYVLLVLWYTSFYAPAAAEICSRFPDLVPQYLAVIKQSIKEKIIRVAVATFVNITSIPDPAYSAAVKRNVNALLVHSALPTVKQLLDRKWTDEELILDLQTLRSTLQEAFDAMSTFDEYISELTTGKLRWSPPHKSEEFWKTNSEKFKEKNWALLKQLCAVINSTPDDGEHSVQLAVGCSDITYIVNEHPESIKIIESLGVKTKIMELMTSEDSEVRFAALTATQAFVAHTFS